MPVLLEYFILMAAKYISCSFIEGSTPAPEEVILAVRITENKIALKSGYNKYLTVCSDNIVRGIADAVGVHEQWEPVFQVNIVENAKRRRISVLYAQALQKRYINLPFCNVF